MTLSDWALNELKAHVTGDGGLTQTRSGRELVKFFSRFGIRDVYDSQQGGLPKLLGKDNNTSRTEYALDRLKMLNGSKKLKEAIEAIVNENTSEMLVKEINTIIKEENYRMELTGEQYIVVGHESYPEEIVKEVHFEEIQKRILDELSKARFQIFIAVAWFTDAKIFAKLLEKKAEGVNIQIAISDDEINRNSGLKFEEHFDVVRISKTGYDNLMHNKFCVIDLNTVINGSYNWSKKAQYNKENITVDYSRALAEQFAEQFIKLKLRKT